MKKVSLLLIAIVFSSITFAQNTTNNLMFVFEKTSDFTTQFENKETPKEFAFTIKNLNDNSILETLENKISGYRGVTSITISDTNENGERTAKLVLYKYANHWKYYEYFFSKIGVYKILINNKEYNPAQIGNL